MSAPLARRGILCGLTFLPWIGAPLAATTAQLSEIGRACERACRHRDWIAATVRAEKWDDDRIDAETGALDDVFLRASREPSRSLADLSAKARLVLPDAIDGASGAFPDELLIVAVLRELAALAPATEGGVR